MRLTRVLQLGPHVLRRDLRELTSHGLGLVGPGDDPDPLGGDHRRDPLDGLLEEGPLAREVEQLLGAVAAALGPEPGAAAAGHDHGVEHGREGLIASGCRSRPDQAAAGILW